MSVSLAFAFIKKSNANEKESVVRLLVLISHNTSQVAYINDLRSALVNDALDVKVNPLSVSLCFLKRES